MFSKKHRNDNYNLADPNSPVINDSAAVLPEVAALPPAPNLVQPEGARPGAPGALGLNPIRGNSEAFNFPELGDPVFSSQYRPPLLPAIALPSRELPAYALPPRLPKLSPAELDQMLLQLVTKAIQSVITTIITNFSKEQLAETLTILNTHFAMALPIILITKINTKVIELSDMVAIIAFLLEKSPPNSRVDVIKTILKEQANLRGLCKAGTPELIALLFKELPSDEMEQFTKAAIYTACSESDPNAGKIVQTLWHLIPAEKRQQYFFAYDQDHADSGFGKACEYGSVETVQFLVKQCTESQLQELFDRANNTDLEDPNFILNACGRVDAQGHEIVVILWQCCAAAARKEVFFNMGFSALCKACETGSPNTVQFLIKQCTPEELIVFFATTLPEDDDENYDDYNYDDRLDWLLKTCTRTDAQAHEIINILWKSCAAETREAIFFSPRKIRNNDEESDSESDEDSDADSEMANKTYRQINLSPFAAACSKGSPEIVRFLLDVIDAPKRKALYLKDCLDLNNNAIACVCARNDNHFLTILQMLFEALPEQDRVDVLLNTKLLEIYYDMPDITAHVFKYDSALAMLCKYKNMTTVINFLRNYVAETEIPKLLLGNPDSNSALHYLVHNPDFLINYQTIFDFFKPHNQLWHFIAKQNNTQQNVLHIAFHYNNVIAAKLLLNMLNDNEKQELLLQRNADGLIPLFYAVNYNNSYEKIIEMILENTSKEICTAVFQFEISAASQADIFAPNILHGVSCLQHELFKKIVAVIPQPTRLSFITKPNNDKETPLHFASRVSSVANLEYLIAEIPEHAKAMIFKMQDENGRTILHNLCDWDYFFFKKQELTGPEFEKLIFARINLINSILRAYETPEERYELLSMQNTFGDTVIDLSLGYCLAITQSLCNWLPPDFKQRLLNKIKSNGNSVLHSLCENIQHPLQSGDIASNFRTVNFLKGFRAYVNYILQEIAPDLRDAFIMRPNNDGYTALHVAINTIACPEVCEILINAITPPQRSEFMQQRDRNGRSVLHLLLTGGNFSTLGRSMKTLECISFILTYIEPAEQAAFINQVDNSNKSALVLFFERYGINLTHPVVRLLQEHGAVIPEEFRTRKRKAATINDQAQSVHLVEFHRATGLSLARLYAKFKPSAQLIRNTVELLQKWAGSLPDRADLDQTFAGDGENYLSANSISEFKRVRAKLWLEKHLKSRSKEGNTNLSMVEVIALWWLEISSVLNNVPQERKIEIERMLVCCLHHLQRMYHLEEATGAEYHDKFALNDPAKDSASCIAGSFNQLMDNLARIGSPVGYSKNLLFGPLSDQVTNKAIVLLEETFKKYRSILLTSLAEFLAELKIDQTYGKFFSMIGTQQADLIKANLKQELVNIFSNPYLCQENDFNNPDFLKANIKSFNEDFIEDIVTLLDPNLWRSKLEKEIKKILEEFIEYLQIPSKLIDNLNIMDRTPAVATSLGKREAAAATTTNAMDVEPEIGASAAKPGSSFVSVGGFAASSSAAGTAAAFGAAPAAAAPSVAPIVRGASAAAIP